MNCYAFLLLGISLTIYLLSNATTVEEYGGGRGRGRGRGYYGRGRGYYGGGGYGRGRGYYRGVGGLGYGRGDVYIYDDEDYYQYPYWYKYIPFLNYY
jgi:hypothetical protein